MDKAFEEMYEIVNEAFAQAQAKDEAVTNNLIALLKNVGINVALKTTENDDGDEEFEAEISTDGGHFYEGFSSRIALDAGLRMTLNTLGLLRNIRENQK